MDAAEPSPSKLAPRHATPVRAPTFFRRVPVTAWFDAPDAVRMLGVDLPDNPEARYVRTCGSWVIWRAGPARRGDARYWAAHRLDPDRWCTFRVFGDGSGLGTLPSGETVTRARRWRAGLRRTP